MCSTMAPKDPENGINRLTAEQKEAMDLPIHDAAAKANSKRLRRILDRAPSQEAKAHAVNLMNGDGQTPLHLAALNENARKTIETLVEAGADIDLLQDAVMGFAPLHLSAREGHRKVTRSLVEHGADLLRMSRSGATPLHMAASYGNVGALRIMLEYAQQDGMIDDVVSALDDQDYTLMHVAVYSQQKRITDLLLSYPATLRTLSVRDFQDLTPLDVAEAQVKERQADLDEAPADADTTRLKRRLADAKSILESIRDFAFNSAESAPNAHAAAAAAAAAAQHTEL